MPEQTAQQPEIDHPSGITPLEFNVLVKPDAPAARSAGGILYTDDTRERRMISATTGMVISVSDTAFTFEHGARPVFPGERVAFNRHSGMQVEGLDGETYFILKDKSIVAVYAPVPDPNLSAALSDLEEEDEFCGIIDDIKRRADESLEKHGLEMKEAANG